MQGSAQSALQRKPGENPYQLLIVSFRYYVDGLVFQVLRKLSLDSFRSSAHILSEIDLP